MCVHTYFKGSEISFRKEKNLLIKPLIMNVTNYL